MSSSSNTMPVLSNLRDLYWESISANTGPHKVLWSGIGTSYLDLIVSFFLIVSSIFNDSEHRANCILSSSLPGKVSQSHVLPSYNMNMMFNQKYTQYQSFSRKITMRIVQVAYPIVSVRVSTKPAIAKLCQDHTSTSQDATLAPRLRSPFAWPFLFPTLECLHFLFGWPMTFWTVDVLFEIT